MRLASDVEETREGHDVCEPGRAASTASCPNQGLLRLPRLSRIGVRMPPSCRPLCAAVPVSSILVALLFFGTATAGSRVSSPKSTPTVYFELAHPQETGSLDPGKPLELAVRLTGMTQGKSPVVTIFEGRPFVRRLVPMRSGGQRTDLHSSVTLEPFFTGFTSPREKALRIKVTFARMRGMRLIPFMTRVVYLTMALPEEAEQLNTAPFSEAVGAGESTPGGTLDLIQLASPADVIPEERITEEDLVPDAMPIEEEEYWRQVSRRISRSWIGPSSSYSLRRGRRPVKVRFRLHANGEAQLIQVEKSSGVPALDELGMQAVVNAHPFPPFPSEVHQDAVDMHVELARSGSAVTHARRTVPSQAHPAKASAKP